MKKVRISWPIACWRSQQEEGLTQQLKYLSEQKTVLAKLPRTSRFARVAPCCALNLEYLPAKCLRVEATGSLSLLAARVIHVRLPREPGSQRTQDNQRQPNNRVRKVMGKPIRK